MHPHGHLHQEVLKSIHKYEGIDDLSQDEVSRDEMAGEEVSQSTETHDEDPTLDVSDPDDGIQDIHHETDDHGTLQHGTDGSIASGLEAQ